jgi:hypothetical protein
MLPFLQERDQVIIEIILNSVSSTAEIQCLNWCRGVLQCIFLSDLVTVDGRYLECFVFDPGPIKQHFNYCFPWECPTKKDWDTWFNFWYNYATTGEKLRVPLGRWTHPTHRKWLGSSVPIPPLIAFRFPHVTTTSTTFNMPLPQNHFRDFLGTFLFT